MLHRCILILSIYAAAVLETSAPLFPGLVSPDWLALLAIGVIWTMSPAEAVLWGALLGFVVDSISSRPMGISMLTFSTLVCVLATLRARWECRSMLSLVLISIVTGSGLLLGPVAVSCFDGAPGDLRTHVYEAIGSAAATGIVAVFVAAAGRALRSGSTQFHSPMRA
jgi:rod shape-determining protein MreD